MDTSLNVFIVILVAIIILFLIYKKVKEEIKDTSSSRIVRKIDNDATLDLSPTKSKEKEPQEDKENNYLKDKGVIYFNSIRNYNYKYTLPDYNSVLNKNEMDENDFSFGNYYNQTMKYKGNIMLPFGFVDSDTVYTTFDKNPNTLICGTVMTGKTSYVNTIICNILMRYKPDEVKFVIINPSKLELSNYNGIPHLLIPVVTDPKKASIALQKIMHEMESRYDILKESRVQNIAAYNEMVDKINQDKKENEKKAKMPFIVVIIDELADLMSVTAQFVEESLYNITSDGHNVGIYSIVVSKALSREYMPPILSNNYMCRVSFKVMTKRDSEKIVARDGAVKLKTPGEVLINCSGLNISNKINVPYITDDEISGIIGWTIKQQIATYDARFENLEQAAEEQGNAGEHPKDIKEEYDDPLYNEVKEFVIEQGKASSSLIQRRFKVGFNRAATILDLLEERGVIGPATGNSTPREILIDKKD